MVSHCVTGGVYGMREGSEMMVASGALVHSGGNGCVGGFTVPFFQTHCACDGF